MCKDWKEQLSKLSGRPVPEDRQGEGKGGNTGGVEIHYPRRGQQGNRHVETPERVLPLYHRVGKTGTEPFLKQNGKDLTCANTGLLFDKFCDIWSGGDKGWKAETPKKGDSVKLSFLKEVLQQCQKHPETGSLLNQYRLRRESLILSCKGRLQEYKTITRFVTGLGMGHVLETGFIWHRTLGVPYLPASSVKGMIRAWAREEAEENEEKQNQIKKLFGDETETGAGDLIIFDAIPTEKPGLELDIMNPHYGDYYNKGKDKNGNFIPPADYLSPNPIFFLTVKKGALFEFAIASRTKNEKNITNGFTHLTQALDNIGAGAKTAVGYGYFK